MANKPKTQLLESVEISRKVEEIIKVKDNCIVYDILEKKVEDLLAETVARYITHETKYELDEFYCEEIRSGEVDEVDEDLIIIDAGSYDPLDYQSLYDFLEEASDEYAEDDYFGDTYYSAISIESSIEYEVSERFECEKPALVNKIISLGRDALLSCIEKVEIKTSIKNAETRRNIKSGKIYTLNSTNTTIQKISIEDSQRIKNMSDEELVYVLIGRVLENSWYCANVIESLHERSFKQIYKRGCEILGLECTTYKTLQYSGTEKEKYIYSMLKESIEADRILDRNLYDASKINIFNMYEFNGFNGDFKLENEKTEIQSVKTYIQNQFILRKCKENVDELLKLLATIFVYEDNGEHSIETLDKVFEYKDLRYSLLYCGIKDIVSDVYPKYLIKEGIKNNLPSEPKDYYPLARNKFRRFVLHVGPTNSGKTYESLEKLKKVNSGAYLAPLRLLALEVQEKLVKEGVKCSLLTGEEEDIVEGSKHICSTIEKLNYQEEYDLVVIDECQMLEDPLRGSAWTAAILGANAREIHLCLAPYAKDLVIELINYCGDTYEVVEHTRDTELEVVNKGFDFRKDLQEGDALVTFSKRKVLNLAAAINTKTDETCSVLFGALPYRSRKRQFENFSQGKSNVLVTTDCIGLGVNLAIKRVIFMEDCKFDGKSNRKLTTSEILQIAGRAGRKNIYDTGQVITASKSMLKAYSKEIKPTNKCYIGLTHHLLNIEGELEDIIYAWKKLDFGRYFEKADISNQFTILRSIKKINLTKEQRYKAIFLPVNTKSNYEMDLLRKYLKCIANCQVVLEFPNMPRLEYDNTLKQLEDYYKGIDLYYSIGKVFDLNLDFDRVEAEREKTCTKINNLLLSSKLKTPKCNTCGKELSWDYDHYRCNECYQRSRNNWYDYEDDFFYL